MTALPLSTSLERTYRYLRIGIAGTVVAIFVAIAQAATTYGWLTSVSDYFYTPARNVFVGSLIAVSLALLALSGRGAERALLDAAALFAPLIALVPTTVAAGAVPGVAVSCTGRCFPPAYEADVANGMIVYLVLGLLVLLVALVLAALGQVSLAAVWPSLLIAGAVVGATGLTWLLAREAFLDQAHFVATTAFFALFAAVAVRNAFPGAARSRHRPSRRSTRRSRWDSSSCSSPTSCCFRRPMAPASPSSSSWKPWRSRSSSRSGWCRASRSGPTPTRRWSRSYAAPDSGSGISTTRRAPAAACAVTRMGR